MAHYVRSFMHHQFACVAGHEWSTTNERAVERTWDVGWGQRQLPRSDGQHDGATLGEGVEDLVARVREAWGGPRGPKLRLLPARIDLSRVRELAQVLTKVGMSALKVAQLSMAPRVAYSYVPKRAQPPDQCTLRLEAQQRQEVVMLLSPTARPNTRQVAFV